MFYFGERRDRHRRVGTWTLPGQKGLFAQEDLSRHEAVHVAREVAIESKAWKAQARIVGASKGSAEVIDQPPLHQVEHARKVSLQHVVHLGLQLVEQSREVEGAIVAYQWLVRGVERIQVPLARGLAFTRLRVVVAGHPALPPPKAGASEIHQHHAPAVSRNPKPVVVDLVPAVRFVAPHQHDIARVQIAVQEVERRLVGGEREDQLEQDALEDVVVHRPLARQEQPVAQRAVGALHFESQDRHVGNVQRVRSQLGGALQPRQTPVDPVSGGGVFLVRPILGVVVGAVFGARNGQLRQSATHGGGRVKEVLLGLEELQPGVVLLLHRRLPVALVADAGRLDHGFDDLALLWIGGILLVTLAVEGALGGGGHVEESRIGVDDPLVVVPLDRLYGLDVVLLVPQGGSVEAQLVGQRRQGGDPLHEVPHCVFHIGAVVERVQLLVVARVRVQLRVVETHARGLDPQVGKARLAGGDVVIVVHQVQPFHQPAGLGKHGDVFARFGRQHGQFIVLQNPVGGLRVVQQVGRGVKPHGAPCFVVPATNFPAARNAKQTPADATQNNKRWM